MAGFNKGTKVQWKWGSGTAEGVIEKVYTQKISRQLKGIEVTRDASDECPAYLIKQSDGDEVLKSHTEIDSV